jgi:hypothetical protein
MSTFKEKSPSDMSDKLESLSLNDMEPETTDSKPERNKLIPR